MHDTLKLRPGAQKTLCNQTVLHCWKWPLPFINLLNFSSMLDQTAIETCSAVDPDPASLDSESQSWSGSRRAKNTHKNREKVNKFHFLNTGCSLLRAEGFSCGLDILYGGLGISKLHFFYQKKKKKKTIFSCIFFLNFLSLKPWIRI